MPVLAILFRGQTQTVCWSFILLSMLCSSLMTTAAARARKRKTLSRRVYKANSSCGANSCLSNKHTIFHQVCTKFLPVSSHYILWSCLRGIQGGNLAGGSEMKSATALFKAQRLFAPMYSHCQTCWQASFLLGTELHNHLQQPINLNRLTGLE